MASLVVHAHGWNNKLHLPELHCRIGTVQAVPKATANHPVNPEKLISYLKKVIADRPETKVWNFSVNEVDPIDPNIVSYLGHELSLLAREHGILPVISAGNKSQHNKGRICPPADCEAAIVVAGRQYTSSGKPGAACPISLPGPGPEGMLKPDVSWFSKLRVLGGLELQGTSFATPLVSTLAAHTFTNLREPTPDLVKALILNSAENESFCNFLGWGSPFHGHLPWTCAPGTVTLAWRSELRPGIEHYWDGIPVPSQMVQNGKIYGSATLTAILRPLLSEEGEGNYFASRLETTLQYRHNGKMKNLLGSMKESQIREQEARDDLAKWHPVRRHSKTMKKGVSFSEPTMRLRARVYTRDLYQFSKERNADLDPQEVTFVLTLRDGSSNSEIYNSVAQQLGSFVESAVVSQDIEVERRG
ncbi:MAG: S8 family peptidase [Alphaproteobacteria bacterium]|nr:S8 family peptidase [Alphaproteobacteria bacterium]